MLAFMFPNNSAFLSTFKGVILAGITVFSGSGFITLPVSGSYLLSCSVTKVIRFENLKRTPPYPLYCHSRGSHRSHPDRKSTRLNSSHVAISYAVFCLKKKKNLQNTKSTQN